jgi:cytochrome c oxidase assembly factor CtaG
MPSPPLALSLNPATAALLGPCAALAALYGWRARELARQRRPVAGWRQACFYASLAVIALALVLIGSAARQLLWAHMLEQLALGDAAALLLVLGLTAALLEPLARPAPLRLLRALGYPPLALALWAANLYAWQLRVLYDSALQHPGVYALEHLLTFVLGVNMWMCLLGPVPGPSWFGERARAAYVLAGRLAAAGLANVFLWSGNVFYPYYSTGEAHLRLSPLADQNIAGAIMLFEQALLTLCLFAWLFRRASSPRGAVQAPVRGRRGEPVLRGARQAQQRRRAPL